jgi:hypothetical protein
MWGRGKSANIPSSDFKDHSQRAHQREDDKQDEQIRDRENLQLVGEPQWERGPDVPAQKEQGTDRNKQSSEQKTLGRAAVSPARLPRSDDATVNKPSNYYDHHN